MPSAATGRSRRSSTSTTTGATRSIATRAFGNTPEVVIERAKEYFDGISASQHGLRHEAFPRRRHRRARSARRHVVQHAGRRRMGPDLRPGVPRDDRLRRAVRSWSGTSAPRSCPASTGRASRDSEILPATLSPELLQDLLRGELGFNGLILTDASQMIGLTGAMRRRDLVPATIAAGCDMFLFFRNPDEDFQYMLDGYRDRGDHRATPAGRARTHPRAEGVAGPAPRRAGGRRAGAGGPGRRRQRAAPRDRGGDRRQDRHADQGHPEEPAAHPGDPPADPAVRDLRRPRLHPHRSARLPGHRPAGTGGRRVRGARLQDRGAAAGRGRQRGELHGRHRRGGHRRLRREVRRRLRLREREGLRPGGGDPDQVVDADGRGDPLVRDRGPDGVRLADASRTT